MKNIIFSFHSTKEGFKGVVKSERTLYLTGFHSTKEGFKVDPAALQNDGDAPVSIPLRKVSRPDFAFKGNWIFIRFHSTKEGFKVVCRPRVFLE